jgi:integrase/recombinase XerC
MLIRSDSQLVTSYARWWRTTDRAESTLQCYVYVLNRLHDRLGGDRGLLTATKADLEEYLVERIAATCASSASVDFRAVRSFYAWALAEEEIEANPAARLRGPKVDEAPVKVATEADYRKMLAVCPKRTLAGRRDAAILAVLWATGARRAEVSRLDVDHLDMDHGTIIIGRSKNGTPRRVPLDVDALAALDRWLRHRGYEPGPLFPSEHGGRLTPNGIGQMIVRRNDEAGTDLSAHQFRRALAARWLRAGGGESALRSMAGWKSPAMVGRYTRMNAEELAHVEYRRLFG